MRTENFYSQITEVLKMIPNDELSFKSELIKFIESTADLLKPFDKWSKIQTFVDDKFELITDEWKLQLMLKINKSFIHSYRDISVSQKKWKIDIYCPYYKSN